MNFAFTGLRVALLTVSRVEWVIYGSSLLVLLVLIGLLLALYVRLRRLVVTPWEKRRQARARDWAARHFPERLQATAAVVGRILTENLGVPYNNLHPEIRLLEDIGMDELEPEEFLLSLGEQFPVVITLAEWSQLRTVGDLVALVQSRVELR